MKQFTTSDFRLLTFFGFPWAGANLSGPDIIPCLWLKATELNCLIIFATLFIKTTTTLW